MIIKTLNPIVDPQTKRVTEWEAVVDLSQGDKTITFLHRVPGPNKPIDQVTEDDMRSAQAAARRFPVNKPVFVEKDIPPVIFPVVDPKTGIPKVFIE